jgi:hypothetical protein
MEENQEPKKGPGRPSQHMITVPRSHQDYYSQYYKITYQSKKAVCPYCNANVIAIKLKRHTTTKKCIRARKIEDQEVIVDF